jgi:hypothetical protein
VKYVNWAGVEFFEVIEKNFCFATKVSRENQMELTWEQVN